MAVVVRSKRRHAAVPVEISTEEWQSYLDRLSRRLLGISAGEFTQRWDSGLYLGTDDPDVMRVAMLLPVGGQD